MVGAGQPAPNIAGKARYTVFFIFLYRHLSLLPWRQVVRYVWSEYIQLVVVLAVWWRSSKLPLPTLSSLSTTAGGGFGSRGGRAMQQIANSLGGPVSSSTLLLPDQLHQLLAVCFQNGPDRR